jgi:hypothetical protein
MFKPAAAAPPEAAVVRIAPPTPKVTALAERLAGLVKDRTQIAQGLAAAANSYRSIEQRLEQMRVEKSSRGLLPQRLAPLVSQITASENDLVNVSTQLGELSERDGAIAGQLEAARAELLDAVNREIDPHVERAMEDLANAARSARTALLKVRTLAAARAREIALNARDFLIEDPANASPRPFLSGSEVVAAPLELGAWAPVRHALVASSSR